MDLIEKMEIYASENYVPINSTFKKYLIVLSVGVLYLILLETKV